MKIVRHCTERLLGGERLWRRLAKKAGFDGTLYVYGYGTGPRYCAKQQRAVGASESRMSADVGEFSPNGYIRVWMPSKCAVDVKFFATPLMTFAHELGHFRMYQRGHEYHGAREEAYCDAYARRLLKEVQ